MHLSTYASASRVYFLKCPRQILCGVRDLKHPSERIKKYECSKVHMNNAVKLAMLGRTSIAAQLDEGHRIAVRKHNEELDMNRHIFIGDH